MKFPFPKCLAPFVLGLLASLSFPVFGDEPRTPEIESYVNKMIQQRAPYETRTFKSFQLKNGLEVLIIQDQSAKELAVSLNVDTGLLSDPPQYRGLAHYLEHVLFLGSDKYPTPEEYRNFMEQNGGFANAFTDSKSTNYLFQVNPSAYAEAIDRFSNVFTHPLFRETYISKELEAIESEYRKNLNNNAFRAIHLGNILANPGHPQSRVFQGNKETLSNVPRNVVIAFFNKHYVASKMKLAVISPLSAEQLQPLIQEKFTELSPNPAPPVDVARELPFYREQDLPRIIQTQPVGDKYVLSLEFPISSTNQFYYSRPHFFLENFIRRKEPGTLQYLLKMNGWIVGLSAHTEEQGIAPAPIFKVTFDLSKSGYDHWKSICGYFFKYLEFLKQQGLQRSYYETQKRFTELDMLFETPLTGAFDAANFSFGMQKHISPTSHTLRPYFLSLIQTPSKNY